MALAALPAVVIGCAPTESVILTTGQSGEERLSLCRHLGNGWAYVEWSAPGGSMSSSLRRTDEPIPDRPGPVRIGVGEAIPVGDPDFQAALEVFDAFHLPDSVEKARHLDDPDRVVARQRHAAAIIEAAPSCLPADRDDP